MPSNVDWDPNLLEESSVKYLFLSISPQGWRLGYLELEQPSVKQLPLHLPHSVFSHGHLYVGFSRWIPNSTPEAQQSLQEDLGLLSRTTFWAE